MCGNFWLVAGLRRYGACVVHFPLSHPRTFPLSSAKLKKNSTFDSGSAVGGAIRHQTSAGAQLSSSVQQLFMLLHPPPLQVQAQTRGLGGWRDDDGPPAAEEADEEPEQTARLLLIQSLGWQGSVTSFRTQPHLFMSALVIAARKSTHRFSNEA